MMPFYRPFFNLMRKALSLLYLHRPVVWVVTPPAQIAMVKGRVKTKSTGEAAVKLYKHGGLSLMEMLTPWVVLGV